MEVKQICSAKFNTSNIFITIIFDTKRHYPKIKSRETRQKLIWLQHLHRNKCIYKLMWNHQNVCGWLCIRFPAWKNYRKMLHRACHKGLSTSPSAQLHFLWSNSALGSNFLSIHIYWAPTGSERRETSKPFRALHVTGTGTQGTENGNEIGTATANYAIRKASRRGESWTKS